MSDDLRERLDAVIREHARVSNEKPYDEKKAKLLQQAARDLRAALRKAGKNGA